MRVRWANLSSLMVVGALLLSMTAGCGLQRVGPVVDPGDEPAATPTPTPVATPAPTPAPTTKPDVPLTPVIPLTARVQNVQTSGLMFTRRVIAVVEVTNPGDRTLSGTVTCTFGKGTDPDQIQTKNVSLMGRETRTFTFEEKSWFDKDAKVEIKTDQAQATQAGFQNFRF